MTMQNLLPETMTVTLETIEALEEASARLARVLRQAVPPRPGRDPGAIEYDSWLAHSPGVVEYDSWIRSALLSAPGARAGRASPG